MYSRKAERKAERGQGVHHSIQTVNSKTYTMNVAAHKKCQTGKSVFRLSEIGVDVVHHDQASHGDIEFTNDDYIFDHEGFPSSL